VIVVNGKGSENTFGKVNKLRGQVSRAGSACPSLVESGNMFAAHKVKYLVGLVLDGGSEGYAESYRLPAHSRSSGTLGLLFGSMTSVVVCR